ncbi:MAG: hypothetical protein ACT6S0_21305 [Roseateles sp.]|uniref:hypothetical protein n=1 Tax=Roseateles sp. TaxID=1971397 RepID=UPI004036D03E
MAKRPKPKQRDGLLFFLPKHTPPLAEMLDDICNPSPRALAKALGVSPRTAQRWLVAGEAPRAALLALFFATRWGRADVHSRAENDARAQAALAFHLRTELDKASAKLARLGQIGEFGSANDPAQGVATEPTTPPAAGPTAPENRNEPIAVAPVSHGETARFSQSN